MPTNDDTELTQILSLYMNSDKDIAGNTVENCKEQVKAWAAKQAGEAQDTLNEVITDQFEEIWHESKDDKEFIGRIMQWHNARLLELRGDT